MVIVKGLGGRDRFQFQTEKEQRVLDEALEYFDGYLDDFLRDGLGMNVHDGALVKEYNAMRDGYRETFTSRGKEQRTISLNRWEKINGYAKLHRRGLNYISEEEQTPEEQVDTKPQRNINLLLTGLSQDKKNTI